MMTDTKLGGIAGVVLRALGKGTRRQERELRLVESLALGGRKQVHLVVCGGERFLVGGGPDAVTCITPLRGAAA